MTAIKILIKGNISSQALIQSHPDLLFKNFKKKAKPYSSLPFTCILALKEKKIVALLVSVTAQKENTAALLSIYVREEFRKKGVAHSLMKTFEQYVRRNKGSSNSVEYQSDWEGTEILEKILQKNSWGEKEKIFELYKINLEENLKKELAKKLPPLAADVRMVRWKELTPADLKKVSAMNFPHSLSPFQMEEKIASNSLALFIKNEIKGWLITHTTKNSIQYTALYIDVNHRKGLFAMHLIRKAAEMQTTEGKYDMLFMIHADNIEMIKMFQKRLIHYCYFQHYIYRWMKILS